ncbi:MAG TPA: CrcB family protein [Jatrophihabitantaceae bacterium]|nr:CrcB family protein [Jatrophihabitantaceae bacterium]
MSRPVDPDLMAGTDRPVGAGPFGIARPSRWPALRPDVIVAVFIGGCLGGWARYAITTTWPANADRFPWATFYVNVAGAVILGLVIAAASVLSSRYVRPLLGTGFCGAFTTFSAVVVTTDQLFAHRRQGVAVAYLAASTLAGLAAAALGLVLGRTLVSSRHRARAKRSQS